MKGPWNTVCSGQSKIKQNLAEEDGYYSVLEMPSSFEFFHPPPPFYLTPSCIFGFFLVSFEGYFLLTSKTERTIFPPPKLIRDPASARLSRPIQASIITLPLYPKLQPDWTSFSFSDSPYLPSYPHFYTWCTLYLNCLNMDTSMCTRVDMQAHARTHTHTFPWVSSPFRCLFSQEDFPDPTSVPSNSVACPCCALPEHSGLLTLL